MEALPSIDPALELGAHVEWIQRLAAGLVRDPQLAGDLAQDVCVLALEKAPVGARRGERLRNWLACVTSTLARQARRTERRRSQRETIAARVDARRTQAEESTFDVVARAALQRRVVEAVMELDEPGRSTVLLRYLQGLDAPAIAELQGVAPAAVRKRLSRALAQLRARLERELDRSGGLARLGLLLPSPRTLPCPRALPSPRALPAASAQVVAHSAWAPATGLLVMSHSSTLLTLAGLLATTALFFAWKPHAAAPLELELSAPGLAAPDAGALEPDSTPAFTHSTRVPDSARTAPAQAASLASPGATPALLARLRILDARGWPLVGARLVALDASGAEVAGVSVDAGGQAELGLAQPLPLRTVEGESAPFLLFEARAPGCASQRCFAPCSRASAQALADGDAAALASAAESVRSLELGEVRLSPAGKIVGRVLEPDGRPAPRAFVHGSFPGLNPFNRERLELFGPIDDFVRRMTRSDEDGWFELDDMLSGEWRIWAGEPGRLWTCSPLLSLPSESLAPLELRLRPLPSGRLVHGRVLDPDGNALPGAYVSSAERDASGRPLHFGWVATTNEVGEFSFALAEGREVDLRAFEDDERFGAATARGVRAGDPGLSLRLPPARRARVSCREPDGRPVDPIFVRVRRVGEDSFRAYYPARGAPRGSAHILVPDEPFFLDTDSDDCLDETFGPFEPRAFPAELALELRRPSAIRGRVRGNGQPIAGARVQLVRLRQSGELDFVCGFPSRLNGFGLEGTRSDERGEFELPIRFEEGLVLFCEAEGWAAAELGPLALDPQHDARQEIVLSRGGSIHGRVSAPAGESAAGVSLHFARGDMRRHEARTDAQGLYSIDGLTAGSWMVRAERRREVQVPGGGMSEVKTIEVPESYELPWDCEVVEGGSTRYDIDLAEVDVADLRGQLLVNGEAAALADLWIQPADRGWSWERLGAPRTRSGLDGHFELDDCPTGEVWLVAELRGGPLDGARLLRQLSVERGLGELSLAVRTTEVELEFEQPPSEALAWISRGVSRTLVVRELPPSPAQRRRLLVAAGDFELVGANVAASARDPLAWERLASATLDSEQSEQALISVPAR